jgi:hypothetical protein
MGCAMSRFCKVISPNGNGFYWEVRTDAGQVIARGVADSHADARSQAAAAKDAAATDAQASLGQQVAQSAL